MCNRYRRSIELVFALLLVTSVTLDAVAAVAYGKIKSDEPVIGRPSWGGPPLSKEILFLLNHPLRTVGFSMVGLGLNYENYDFEVTSISDINEIIAAAGRIKDKDARVVLEIGKGSKQMVKGRPPVNFGLGWRFDPPPKAIPPTLTIYVEHPLVEINKLVIPDHVSVAEGRNAKRNPNAASLLIERFLASRAREHGTGPE